MKRGSRSLQNLNHLSLAPLSLRMPLSDPELLSELNQPRINSHSRSVQASSTLSRTSNSPARKLSKTGFPKSKSSTYLMSMKNVHNLSMTPGDGRSYQNILKDEIGLDPLSHRDWNDSDWFMRTGAILASSARESKGQAWLFSRASSTSLVRLQDDGYQEWAQDRRPYSRRTSNRGSMFGSFDEDSSSRRTSTISSNDPASRCGSLPATRLASRAMSRSGSKVQLHSSPLVADSDSYFDYENFDCDEPYIEEPDFLGIKVSHDLEVEKQDEDTIRKLARDYSQGLGGWIERMLGWRLIADSGIGEIDSGTEEEDEGEAETDNASRTHGSRNLPIFQTLDFSTHSMKVDLPPPEDGKISVWQDAAWILSVAAKVFL